MKKIICVILLVCLALSIPVFATGDTIQAVISNVKINIDSASYDGVNPIIAYNGYNYVPVGELCRAMGADVYWLDKTKTIEIFTDKTETYTISNLKSMHRLTEFYHKYCNIILSADILGATIALNASLNNSNTEDLESIYKSIGEAYTATNKQIKTYNTIASNINTEVKFDEVDTLVGDLLIYHGQALERLAAGNFYDVFTYEIKATTNSYKASSIANSEYDRLSLLIEKTE